MHFHKIDLKFFIIFIFTYFSQDVSGINLDGLKQVKGNRLVDLPCRGMLESADKYDLDDTVTTNPCYYLIPRSVQGKGRLRVQNGYYDVNYDVCLKGFDRNSPTAKTTCNWYYCESRNGCVRPSAGEICDISEEIGLIFLIVIAAVSILFMAVLFLVYIEQIDKWLSKGCKTCKNFMISMLSFIGLFLTLVLSSISMSECDQVFEFDVVNGPMPSMLPTLAPIPSPTAYFPSSLPTISVQPTPFPTPKPTNGLLPEYLSKGIEFDKTALPIVTIIFLCLLAVFSFRTHYSVMTRKRTTFEVKLTTLGVLIPSQFDMASDVAYIGFSVFAAPFLRLMALLVLGFPLFLSAVTHYKDGIDLFFQVVEKTIESMLGFWKISVTPLQQWADSMLEKNVKVPCITIQALLGYVLLYLTSVIVILISMVVFFGFFLIQLVGWIFYKVLYVSSKMVIIEVGHNGENEDAKNAFFNESILYEIVFEAAPQMIISSVNESYTTGKLSALFYVQIVSTAFMLLNELYPIIVNIINEESFTKGLTGYRRTFQPPSDKESFREGEDEETLSMKDFVSRLALEPKRRYEKFMAAGGVAGLIGIGVAAASGGAGGGMASSGSAPPSTSLPNSASFSAAPPI